MDSEPEKLGKGPKPDSPFDTPAPSLQVDATDAIADGSDPEAAPPTSKTPIANGSPASQQQNTHTPPNGGLKAWIQVASGFAVFFNTWGVLNTFGVFQTYYESGELFGETSSNIAWIGSIQAYCVLIGGLISGPIYDRGHFRALLSGGSFLIVLGFMMLSICRTYWQALLAQGFCVGIGAGLLFVPSLAVLPAYFSTRLGLAMGLSASGSSLGGVIYPIMFYRLLNSVGFGWAVRAIAFVSLGTLLIPVALMKMGFRPTKPRAILDWAAFTDLPFVMFVVSTAIGFVGLYVMLFYVSYFALASETATPEMAFYLVPILNVASMFGRTLPNALSDKTGPISCMYSTFLGTQLDSANFSIRQCCFLAPLSVGP